MTTADTEPLDPRPETPADALAQGSLFGLQGRVVLVVGLGESGLAMARWADYCGAQVCVADTRRQPERLETLQATVPRARIVRGDLDTAWLDGVDLVAWSPGLSIERGASADLRRVALERSIPVVGEIELFAQALAGLRADGQYQPRLVCITGTNGKTTTTRLVEHLCAHAGLDTCAAGNIAPAALDALRQRLEEGRLPEVWVLELSSFQLALTDNLAADAATILNVTQDHLDWHVDMASYVAAKQRIYRGARHCVFNRDDPLTRPTHSASDDGSRSRVGVREASTGRTVSFGLDSPAGVGDFGIIDEGALRWLAQAAEGDEGISLGRRRRGAPVPVVVRRLMPAEALRIRGAHNQANALAALSLAHAIGVPMASMLHGLRSFAGEPHRCELVASLDGIDYYDDSKGTNVGATVAALQGLGKRCVLIAGGDGKGQDFSPMAPAVARHARAVILIGRDAPRLRVALAESGVALFEAATLEQAVQAAASAAEPGDAVLLSPACASFDMFRDYAHRAQVFVDAVRELALRMGVPC